MKKTFILDTNILMRSPRAIHVFEDNDIMICDTTLEELDGLKEKQGDTGYNAREALRILNKLRERGNLHDGVTLDGGGTLKIIPDCKPANENEREKGIPQSWSLSKPDNRIIDTAIKNNAILVTNDISMTLKAESTGLKTETFRNEQASEDTLKYTGRAIARAPSCVIDSLYEYGSIPVEEIVDMQDVDGKLIPPKFERNQFITVIDVANPSHSALAFYDGAEIVALRYTASNPYGIKPRNAGQRMAIEALMAPAEEIPLVILKGPAGTAKTFLSLATGLEQVQKLELYKKLLILRPNIKFDDDIGFLKGDEMDKIMPLIRPCLDNLEALVSQKGNNTEKTAEKIKELFDKGIVTAEALAYLRGRSISNTFILIDEAQNTTPNQMLGIITRCGIGSKIVIVGDPDQIDNPKIDKRNNGLVYAAERMKGHPLCMQICFDDEECVRSPLALAASQIL